MRGIVGSAVFIRSVERSMLKKKVLSALLGGALIAFAGTAAAQSTDQLIKEFTSLAGSEANARSLVEGLRNAEQVELTSGQARDAEFTPPTGKMGNGNVNIALSLARASLDEQGITDPTPRQLEAAVMDVLELRAEGKGWGQIAQSLGFKLGDVMRSERAQPAVRSEKMARAERGERPAHIEKPERPARIERFERPVRPERPEHAGRPAR
jgi:hypothetical protein